MKKFLLIISMFILPLRQTLFAQSSSEELAAKLDSSLTELVKIQMECTDIHPCLKEFHPVAVPDRDSLLIFDYSSADKGYKLVKETKQPFPLPEGIQASFPLSVYDNKPVCIVNPKTFSSIRGYTTVMHEFIHCCQYNSVESELKQDLQIYKTAMENKDYSWEITHPFPYDDSLFIRYYESYVRFMDKNDMTAAKEFRHKLKDHLSKTDFEYMLWEEWKEGTARYVENKICDRLNIDRNNYGKEKPYNRVSFYYGGELLITRLTGKKAGLPSDMKLLFGQMRDF
jgi:hypothetical protein